MGSEMMTGCQHGHPKVLLHVTRVLCIRPLPMLRLGILSPVQTFPGINQNNGQNQISRFQGFYRPSAQPRKAFFWCSMTDPLIEVAQIWTWN